MFTPQRDASGLVINYASLPLNAWHEIADTKMVKLLPELDPNRSNANDMNNVMAAWGSSANDPATADMHLHGGAHGANAENNGWYTFNTRKADWRITVAPLYMGAAEAQYLNQAAALIGGTWTGSYNLGMPPEFIFLPVPGSVRGAPTLANPNADSSGRVAAHHAWHKLAWVSWIGSGRVYSSNASMYLLDPATGTVEAKQRYRDTDFQYNTADPVTQRIYGLTNSQPSDYWGFREYDPVADRIVAEYRITISGEPYTSAARTRNASSGARSCSTTPRTPAGSRSTWTARRGARCLGRGSISCPAQANIRCSTFPSLERSSPRKAGANCRRSIRKPVPSVTFQCRAGKVW